MLEWQPREHHDAVVAFLAVERDVVVAQPLETLARESVVRALGLLQTKNVGTRGLDKLRDEIDAKAHRVDVPGGDRDLHARDGLNPAAVLYAVSRSATQAQSGRVSGARLVKIRRLFG